MNKDVIYIEPEDDITDIIAKIENSKEKIVALIPPKKVSVFRSIVNIKLIAKAGVNTGKTVVLVTVDPSIIKLAGVTKIPVTKNLQTAPAIPEVEAENVEPVETIKEDVLDSDNNEKDTDYNIAEQSSTIDNQDDDKNAEEEEEEDKGETDESDEDKKTKEVKKSSKTSDNGFKEWVSDHKKWLIFGGIFAGILILFLIWAFGIAPAADVIVSVRTSTTNFSENANFTTKLSDENITEGKLYLDEKKNETKLNIEIEATGKKNVGEKATGEVVIYAFFKESGTRSVEGGATFTNNGLKFTANETASLSWDGSDVGACENQGQASAFTSGCLISGRVKVTASEPGEDYNIAATSTGWSTTANVGAYSDNAMSGGSDKTVTILLQSDVDAAVAKIAEENTGSNSANKQKLLATLEEGAFIIDSSFKESLSEPKTTPKVGEEVEEGKKARLEITTTDSIYVIDKTKVEEFISEKAKLTDDYKIYEMNDPFIENFTEVGEGYIGKIKTSFVSGPKVTENDVINIIKGKGLGEARADLLDKFSGIDSNKTKISVPYPWIFSVPDNPTKITVTIEVEE